MEENKEEVKNVEEISVEEEKSEEVVQIKSIVQEEKIKEKNNKGKIIAILFVLFLIIVTIIVFFFVKNDSNKKESPTNKGSNSFINDTDSNKNINSNINSNFSEQEFNSDEQEFDSIDNESNTNININTNTNNSNIKEEYLDLTNIPKYELDITYSKPTTFEIGVINNNAVSAEIGIENKKAYLKYKYSNEKVLIEGIDNVKAVLVDASSSCAYYEFGVELFVLTEAGDIYTYSIVLSDYPEYVEDEIAIKMPSNNSEIYSVLNTASKNMKKMNLSKKYKEVLLADNYCGPGCGCGRSLVGTASDGKKYIISEEEIPLEKKYNYSAIIDEGEYFVSLDGTIYVNFEDGDDKKFNFKPKYIFDSQSEVYVLSVDFYLYELDSNASNRKVKNSKVSKIAKRGEYNFIIYFEDGGNFEIDNVHLIKF